MQYLLDKIRGDRTIWLVVIILSLFSVLAVYSSTGTLAYKYKAGNTEFYLLRHFSLLVAGIGIMYMVHLVPYRYYSRIAQLLMLLSIPLLIITLFYGTELNEARRWITLPLINVSFQTSDLAKLGLIMYIARTLSRNQHQIKDFRNGFLPVFVPVVIICGLIAPADLSTALLLAVNSFILMFIGRISMKYLGMLAGLGGVALLVILLLSYVSPQAGRIATWENRVENFLYDQEGPYQVQQAKIAIAKGGVLPSGPGTSTQRNFLPHPYSDFIFAIIIEEYGLLLGGLFIVFLYLLFLFRSIRIFVMSPRAFGAFLAVGLSISLVFQALVNMGVTVHLLPVTGLTLPFISMGGTSIWFTSISFGIILSVSRSVEKEEEANEA